MARQDGVQLRPQLHDTAAHIELRHLERHDSVVTGVPDLAQGLVIVGHDQRPAVKHQLMIAFCA